MERTCRVGSFLPISDIGYGRLRVRPSMSDIAAGLAAEGNPEPISGEVPIGLTGRRACICEEECAIR